MAQEASSGTARSASSSARGSDSRALEAQEGHRRELAVVQGVQQPPE